MNELIKYLKNIGIHINISESSSPIKLFAFSIFVLSLISLFCVLNIILYIYDIYSHYYTIDLFSYLIPSGDKNDSMAMDPVRWWPSGVPQGWTIVGTALATFGALTKIQGISPRMRVLGALGSAGVSATQITYHSAIENPVGFNRLMWGLSEYKKTGSWPSLEQVANSTTDKQLNDFAVEAIKHVDNSKVENILKEVSDNKFLPSSDFSDFIDKFINLIFKETMQVLKPVPVQGFFDDLIGQRMFIDIILFILCICVILLFIIFIFNLIFLLNKDKIIKKFDNKFITFYVKYQTVLSWITLFYIPIFIITGLFTLCHGLHWLVTNQIPYDSLGIDLHQFISSSPSPTPISSTKGIDIELKGIILILISNKIKFYNNNIYNKINYPLIFNKIFKERRMIMTKTKINNKPLTPILENKNKLYIGEAVIMSPAIAGGMKLTQSAQILAGKIKYTMLGIRAGGSGIVNYNLSNQMSEDIINKDSNNYIDLIVIEPIKEALHLTGNYGIDFLLLIQNFQRIQLILLFMLGYNFLMLYINEKKLEEFLLKIMGVKIVNFILNTLQKFKKTVKIFIIFGFLLLFITNVLAYHYLDFYINNIEDIIRLYFK